ncbi:MAG: hypothetical protein BWK80_45540 [Desulfobacteraceae bacterium IS3]|nr:MAG: hypothetical protein BWK80_45540 [Desulfobacteraceae bacterium IS3]
MLTGLGLTQLKFAFFLTAKFRKGNRKVSQRYILKLCETLRELCATLRLKMRSLRLKMRSLRLKKSSIQLLNS